MYLKLRNLPKIQKREEKSSAIEKALESLNNQVLSKLSKLVSSAKEKSSAIESVLEKLKNKIRNQLLVLKSYVLEEPYIIKISLEKLEQIDNHLAEWKPTAVFQKGVFLRKKLKWVLDSGKFLLQKVFYIGLAFLYVVWGMFYIILRALYVVWGVLYYIGLQILYILFGLLYVALGLYYIVWITLHIVWSVVFVIGKLVLSLSRQIKKLYNELLILLGKLFKNFVLISSILYILLAIVFYFCGLYFIGESVAKTIKEKDLHVNQEIYIQFNPRAKSIIDKNIDGGAFAMIGKAGNFIFVYNRCKKIPLGIPVSVISTILVRNDENEQSFEGVTINPPAKDEELLQLQQEIKNLEAELKELKKGDHEEIKNNLKQILGRLGHSSKLEPLAKIYFDQNSGTLDDKAEKKLDMLLDSGALGNLAIFGFADRKGDADYNRELSMERAVSVRKFLMQKGIDKVTIISSVDGLGEENAPVPTHDDVWEEKNRVVYIYQID